MNNSKIFAFLGMSLFALAMPAMGQDRAETAAGIRAGYTAAVQAVHRQLLEEIDCSIKSASLDFMLQPLEPRGSEHTRILMCENAVRKPVSPAG